MTTVNGRCQCCGQAVPNIDGVVVDDLKKTVTYNGKSATFQPNQMNLIRFLAEKPGVVRATESIYHHIYGNRLDGGPDPKIVTIMVCNVRPRLLEIGLAIVNYWGRGYSLQPIIR